MIAIHDKPCSLSDEWAAYCRENNIDYKMVDCNRTDIISHLEGCQGLLWNWWHDDSRSILYARQLTYSLERIGMKVYPDSNTCWHFDDKVGQKYLFEALMLPFVKTYIFYDKEQAKKWIRQTTFPKVFKLRGGASSVNVRLVKSKIQAYRLVNKAFGRGFNVTGRFGIIKDRYLIFRKERKLSALIELLKGYVRLVIPKYDYRMRVRDKGYVYFQDYIQGNEFDVRVVVIGEKAFSIKREIRKNDFRASGSGHKNYDHREISSEYIETAFLCADKLKMQSVAFDFLNNKGRIFLVEISYAFVTRDFPGYWDRNLQWHQGNCNVAGCIIKEFLSALNK